MAVFSIDVREACRKKRTGKGQWTYGFVNEFLNREHKIVLLTDQNLPKEWEGSSSEVIIYPGGFSWHLRVSGYLKKNLFDSIYISPTSFIVPSLVNKSIKTIPIIHDLIAFQKGKHDIKAKMIERLLLNKAIKSAHKSMKNCDNTRNDLVKKYPFASNKTTAIFAGPSNVKTSGNSADERIILCVGTLSPRKNQLRLIKAYQKLPDALKSKYKLVLAGGRGWNDKKIIKEAQLTNDVNWIGYVKEDKYHELLRTCTVLALPSLYEGFGLQILDAEKMGVPVLCSDMGSLTEVAGNCAVVVNPLDVESIKNGLEKILSDESLRSRLHEEGPVQSEKFSWKRTVDLFLDAI